MDGESVDYRTVVIRNSQGRRIPYLGSLVWGFEFVRAAEFVFYEGGGAPHWPRLNDSLPDKLMLMGRRPIFSIRGDIPIHQIVDAAWRNTPVSIWPNLAPGVIVCWSGIFVASIEGNDNNVTEPLHITGAARHAADLLTPCAFLPDDSPRTSANRDFRAGCCCSQQYDGPAISPPGGR